MLSKCAIFVFALLVVCLLSGPHSLCIAADADKPAERADGGASQRKVGKNWNKISYNDIEKGWEKGDEEEELEHDFEINRKIQERKRPKVDMNDGSSIRSAYEKDPFLFSSGGMMVFVDLKPKQPDGSAWDKKSVDFLSKKYASLLRSGGIITSIYNIEENRLLINLDKTWYTKDMLIYLCKQPEVASFTVNSKTHTPKEYLVSIGEADDDDDL